MVKKNLAIGLSVVMAASMLAGCGGKEAAPETTAAAAETQQTEAAKTEGDTEAAEEKSGENVTITYISSTILESPEGDFEKKCIEEFNALGNGITVEVEGVSANDLMKST